MKIKQVLFLATISSFFIVHSAFGQGALTPPGPPGPTMLTLSQMEPRTPISGPFNITQPGSYYLTTNISVSGIDAIHIEANNVKLDLNGYTVSSTTSPASGYALYCSTVTNVTIIDGCISSGVTNNGSGVFGGSGFGYGIYGGGFNVRVQNVSISGCLDDAIHLTDFSSVVEACTVNEAGGAGIQAQCVSDSTAMNCGNAIIAQTANNCYGQGYNYGIYTYTANNCYGQAITGDGLYAADTATGCTGSSSSNYGLYAGAANNCYGTSTTGDGLVAGTADNCFATSSSGTGVFVDNANNCYGSSNGGGYGVYADYIATGCYGYSSSGTGLDAFIASVCHGVSPSGTPLSLTHNVNSF